MFKCKPGDKIKLSLELDKSDYLLKIESQGEEVGFSRIPSKRKMKRFFGYALFPYFGGIESATHDMDIYLKKII